MKTISSLLLACGLLSAQAPQAPNPTQQSVSPENQAPVYRITVVARTMKAINYNHRSGPTNIGFRGTALMPKAVGEARVESKQGVIKIDAWMEKLEPASKFGDEYLTYVMWAITPEGRATNVGEILLNGGGRSKLNATTELQSFGLIVTAEPYFAVTQPSDVVVMENFVVAGTTGTIEELEAKYELLQRGQYVLNVNPAEIKPMLDRKVPLELYEARNAVQIARWTGAQRYAADTFQKALWGLENAEGYLKGKAGSKPIGTVAREAVQMAEDARIITIKKIAAEELASERHAGLAREQRAESARSVAQSDAQFSEQARINAQANAKMEADRVALAHDAETAAAKRNSDFRLAAVQTDADRLKRENAAQAAIAQSEADRLKLESEGKIAAAQALADRLKQENSSQAATAQAEADRLKMESDAKIAAAQAEADRLKMESDAKLVAAQSQADRMKQENAAQTATAQSEADRLKMESDAKLATAQSEADRMKRENAAQSATAQTEANRLKRENDLQLTASQTEVDRLKRENDAQRAASKVSLDRAATEKTQADAERAQLRSQILLQLNAVLQTRDTARGLIVNMSDVLFDTAKYSLRPNAREKLAKVAGIFSGHPGLRLQVEGFTDSVGGEDYNQQLSENRAGSVRDYLTEAGVPLASVTAKGFGKTQPVASNDTPTGRQQNRRVELVVSGDVIGSDVRTSAFPAK